ncbi:MAG: response regulator [Proteobacteria bacterium]|nr:response regulator [Pseudomonadota bacterium]
MNNRRILIVDDNQQIHEDFKQILTNRHSYIPDLPKDHWHHKAKDLFGTSPLDETNQPEKPIFTLDCAHQGKEAYQKVVAAVEEGHPYAVIFTDMRMPPGWDGIQTIRHIWEVDPYAEVAICTAFADYSWEEILKELGPTDQLQFLRKPFDTVSVQQMALALTQKWNLAKQAREYTEHLEKEVAHRTKELRDKVEALQKATKEINQLRGILPMCAWCHKVRTDDDYWHQVDDYLNTHTNMDVSHGMCPECYKKMKHKLSQNRSPKSDPPQ